MTEWNDSQPIFLQIRQRLVEMILKGQVKPGEAVPSIGRLRPIWPSIP